MFMTMRVFDVIDDLARNVGAFDDGNRKPSRDEEVSRKGDLHIERYLLDLRLSRCVAERVVRDCKVNLRHAGCS